MIEMTQVFKIYPSQIEALSDINLKISPEEFIFVTGPSGSGKTTLLHILFCLEKPTRGQVMINGIDITRKGFKKCLSVKKKDRDGLPGF